jgi:hypothetical protein
MVAILETMLMLEPAYHTTGSWLGNHREINYKICTAIDLTKVDIVIRKLVEEGMEPGMAEIFRTQADVLVASLRTENNRLKVLDLTRSVVVN